MVYDYHVTTGHNTFLLSFPTISNTNMAAMLIFAEVESLLLQSLNLV